MRIGDPYEFRPTASDSDGDTLTFAIDNLPTWANFDTKSGRLSGTPSSGDVGQYSDIRIEVSDGKIQVGLAAFDIMVTQVGNLAITLHWNPPTENVDGSPLTDLAGYIIYYGFRSGRYSYSVRAANPGLSTYTVDGLVPGVYYFAAAAYTHSGIESRLSGEISVKLD